MSKRSVGVIVAVVASLLAAACSRPPKLTTARGGEQVASPNINAPVSAPGGGPSTTAASGVPAVVNGNAPGTAPGSNGGPPAAVFTPTPQSQLSGGGDDAQAKAVGALIHPQSTQRRQPYATGVGDKTIQLDFAYDATSCGVNVTNAITAAGAALPTPTQFYRAAPSSQDKINAEIIESIKVMVAYWNAHGFDAAAYAPSVRKLMGNDPANQYYGRHLVANIIDGGSNQCPDKTKAAAVKAAEQDHAFTVFNNLEGDSPAGAYNMAADLNAEPATIRPMHFGSLWLSDQDYTRFAPYAWTQFASGSTIVREEASYLCAQIVGHPASRSPDHGLQGKVRKFGFIHTNLAQDVRLANEFKGYLNQDCGGNIITKEVTYDGTDFGKAQQDDLNLITQLKTSGVTSVIMLAEPIQPLFILSEAKSQGYYPEWIWDSFGYVDSSTVQRIYDQAETAGSFGTSNLGIFGGFGFGAGDPFKMYHSTHLTAPDGKACDPSSRAGMEHGDGGQGATSQYCKAPTALVTWYYTMLPTIAGVLFSGPDLTPQNVTNGLQAFPATRYGGNGPTTDPRPALVGAGPGRYNFIVDAVEWRWRPDFTSPPPESKKGWVEYPDCQRHYLTWPDGLAPNWEKNGSNYGAWCGNASRGDYPRTLSTDGN